MLMDALSRTLADRLSLMDISIGRKGFLGYLKALGSSNVVKVVPAHISASESQANGQGGLKVICGANISYLDDSAWISDKTPMTFAEVRVSPSNAVRPNLGAVELAEAIGRVLPFTSQEDGRPVLQCVRVEAKDGKLTLVSADGFRLAVVTLNYDDGEGHALIHQDDLQGIVSALKRAKRVKLSFDTSGDSLDGTSLILDTELIRYRWRGFDGTYPDYEKLIPADVTATVSIDANEALKAVSSLKALADSKSYPVDITFGNGKVTLSNPDEKGQAELNADTEGDGYIRIDGSYLSDVLKACGGMVEMKYTSPISPMLFCQNGYQVVVMPMITEKAKAYGKTEEDIKAEAETVAEAIAEVEGTEAGVAEPEQQQEAEKPKRKRKAREAVAVG